MLPQRPPAEAHLEFWVWESSLAQCGNADSRLSDVDFLNLSKVVKAHVNGEIFDLKISWFVPSRPVSLLDVGKQIAV